MSEPIPEAIPTSADPRSRRPIKRARVGDPATVAQANEIENLMYDPERPVDIPELTSSNKPGLSAPPEIVANVQGSSAGAGSGEFHVYKASRRREYERLRTMDEEAKKEEEDAEWEARQRELRAKDEEKARKNREKRNKKKGKKGGQQSGIGNGESKNEQAEKARVNGSNKQGLQIPRRESDEADETVKNDFSVAEIAKEVGITIHDDD